MRVVSIVGARPQFIKLMPVSAALSAAGIEETVVHTGQHYDSNMSADFFAELGLRAPDFKLDIGPGTPTQQTSRTLAGLEPILADAKPDFVIVFGDTTSTLSGAVAAAQMGIPVAHVEAGLRSHRRDMPEERNRVVTDHLSSVLFAPSPSAVANLRAEGIFDGVVEVGDVMVDALEAQRHRLSDVSAVALGLGARKGDYAVATLHRAGNTDDPDRLRTALELLGTLGCPVIFPVHPRTKAAIDAHGLSNLVASYTSLIPISPIGYLDTLNLVSSSRALLTDSGGMQKEAYLLGAPCISLRSETEWVETVSAGWNTLVDLDAEAARAALGRPTPEYAPPLYGDGAAARRIAAVLAASMAG